jgi:hypothetical protein
VAAANPGPLPVVTNDPNHLSPYTSNSVSLCVAIQRYQTSIDRGQTARWVISAWTEGGNVPDATVRLAATPTIVSGVFNFGCGSNDGTASCDLGEIDSTSAQRELEAQVVVPATDTSVTSVQLKVTGSAAHLATEPEATVAIAVKAAAAGGPGAGGTTTSSNPLPVGNLPFLNGSSNSNGSSSTLSPGGNAGGLFPTLNPSSPQSAGGPAKPGQRASASTVANTSALPLGAPVVGAQLIGLGVLALAFVLAVTRLSIRRRPVVAAAATGVAGGAGAATGKQADKPNPPADDAKPEAGDNNPSDGDD